MTQLLPRPGFDATGRPVCSGSTCPLWSDSQAGWCTLTRQVGRRDRSGSLRTCVPRQEVQQGKRWARGAVEGPIQVRCLIQQLPHAKGLALPAYETPGSAGMDVRAAVMETVTVGPHETVAIPTGLIICVPLGFELQVRPRSGFARRHQVTVGNSPGTIDADYRGEISVLLINHSWDCFDVTRGQRIAQLVLARSPQAVWEVCEDLVGEETERGAGGFGSTGVA